MINFWIIAKNKLCDRQQQQIGFFLRETVWC